MSSRDDLPAWDDVVVGGLVRMVATGYRPRPLEVYGDVKLSVQGGAEQLCSPRQDGLPIDAYAEVECALFRNREWVAKPSDLIETEEFDGYWSHEFNGSATFVGIFVPQAVVERLRAALRWRAGMEDAS